MKTMRYWLYPQYYGGGKGPTLRGVVWKWIKRMARRFPKESGHERNGWRRKRAAVSSPGKSK